MEAAAVGSGLAWVAIGTFMGTMTAVLFPNVANKSWYSVLVLGLILVGVTLTG